MSYYIQDRALTFTIVVKVDNIAPVLEHLRKNNYSIDHVWQPDTRLVPNKEHLWEWVGDKTLWLIMVRRSVTEDSSMRRVMDKIATYADDRDVKAVCPKCGNEDVFDRTKLMQSNGVDKCSVCNNEYQVLKVTKQ